ncbi:MAG: hypothetical protein EHM17_11440 [Verrucomicrobiaceae bacterium]|nr:MAG: hypothetical protein EHM17_11440 [Verrucomicrobiaceae bacterium]
MPQQKKPQRMWQNALPMPSGRGTFQRTHWERLNTLEEHLHFSASKNESSNAAASPDWASPSSAPPSELVWRRGFTEFAG